MSFFNMIQFLLSIVVPGYLLARLIFPGEFNWMKSLALGWGVGSFFVSLQIFFIIFILRLPLGLYFWSLIIIETLILLYFAHKKKRLLPLKQNKKNLNRIELFLMLVILGFLLFSLILGLNLTTVNWDSLAMWSVKAKLLFKYNSVSFNPEAHNYWWQFAHPYYPWQVPILSYWQSLNLGRYGDMFNSFISWSYFSGIIILLVSFLSKYIKRVYALVFGLITATMPLIFYHSYNFYADIILTYYVLAAMIFFYEWLNSRQARYLWLTGLFAAMGGFVKNEAIFFIIAFGLVFALAAWFNKKWSILFQYVAAVFVSASPWWLFKIWHSFGFSNVPGGLGWHPEVFRPLFYHLFVFSSWNIWWWFLLAILIIYAKVIIRDKKIALLGLWWLLSLGAFLGLYLFTNIFLYVVDGTADSRNFIALTVTSVYFVGILWQYPLISKRKNK